MCAVAAIVPGREVVNLETLFVRSLAVEFSTDDLAVAATAVPALTDHALAFPP